MDEVDIYLERRLKNWAALYRPAPGDRQRLLRNAKLNRMDMYWQVPPYWTRIFSNQVANAINGVQYNLPASHNSFLLLNFSQMTQSVR
jgi:hypothetical protein